MDSTDSIAIRDVLVVASPFIKVLVESYITPRISKLATRFELDRKKYYVPTSENFSEYFHRTYKKLSIVNTLVFNNSQRLLKDIYIPLTINSTEDQNNSFRIDGFPSQLCTHFERVLITDTAGMGKSTLMKMIFLEIIDEQLGIPIIIELRRLNKNKTIIQEITEQLSSIDKDFNSDLLLELISEGGFILILDGYDEISLLDRDVVTIDIQTFIEKSYKNKFFMTSRPEKALSAFGSFKEFKIQPLKKKEAFELLRKYDHNGSLSSLLIKKLGDSEMSNIDEFLTNPLLVSLLFTAFEHKQAIPFKKYLFYRQVYDANFESHDLTKGDSYSHDKYCKLEIDDFHRILRHIGFNCLKIQKIEFSKDELLKLIDASREFNVGLAFNSSDFLQDILRTVPIFAQDGNYYRWAHKSLQEYFAAQFLYLDSKDKQSDILRKLYESPNLENYMNILDLYYDMDYKTFRNVIEFDLLQTFRSYITKSYQQEYEGVSENEIKARLEISFLLDVYFIKVNDSRKNFDGRKFDDLLKSNLKPDPSTIFDGMLLNPPGNSSILGLNYRHFKFGILRLFANKNNSVVKRFRRGNNYRDYKKFSKLFKNEYELNPVNDSNTNIFNNKAFFNTVTEHMRNTSTTGMFLDYDEALSRLKEIEKSIQQESSDNFLVGGI